MSGTAVGFRAKTGRAIAIALSLDGQSATFVWREEVSLVDPSSPETGQPFHEVMELPWAEALVAVQPFVRAIERVAEGAVRRIAERLGVRAIGVVGSPPRQLERLGNPHIRAHAAEGQLFRNVLEVAAKNLSLRCRAFSEEEIESHATAAMRKAMAPLGRAAGRPWRADERLAATAAWLALEA